MGIDHVTMSTFWFCEQLDQLVDGAEFLEVALYARADEIRESWERSLTDLEGDYVDIREADLVAEHDRYAADLPQTVRQAMMVAQYALLEGFLERMCQSMRARAKLEVEPSDLKDRGVVRSKAYLTKVVGLSLDLGGKHWHRASLLGRL